MRIELDIPSKVIAQLFSSAIDGGDPVTTAKKGGWCEGIYWRRRSLPDDKLPDGYWYSEAKTYESAFVFEVIEIDDEETGHETKHKVRPSDVARGLAVMAKVFPRQFAQVLRDDVDAPAADCFLQAMLFGEEKYA